MNPAAPVTSTLISMPYLPSQTAPTFTPNAGQESPSLAPRGALPWRPGEVNRKSLPVHEADRPLSAVGARSACSRFEKHGMSGRQDNEKIEEETIVFDVVEVVRKLGSRVLDRCAIGIVNLRPARHSRANAVSLAIEGNLGTEHVDEERSLGPRSNEAHVAAQHVPNLRQLVEPSHAQDPADGGDTLISMGGPLRCAAALRVDAHRAEFIDGKGGAVTPDAFLPIENRSSTVETDRHRGEQ